MSKKNINKTFQSCGVKLKLCQMYKNAMKHVTWKVEIKVLPE